MDKMDNSMKVGQYILNVLKDNDELTAALKGDDKIWPLVAHEDTLYPFVIYQRDNMNVTYTKQVGHDNLINITYRVYSEKYDEALNIANIIRNILERNTINFEDEIKINDLRVVQMYEQFTGENGFCQSITFQAFVE